MGSRTATMMRESGRAVASSARSSLLNRPSLPAGSAKTGSPCRFSGISAQAGRDLSSAFAGAPLPIQKKLAVGSSDDPLEREADAMAKSVVCGAAAPGSSSSSGSPVLRRQCSCGGSCDKCKEEEKGTLQRKAVGAPTPVEAPPVVHDVLRGPGRPLDASVRGFFEPRFGADFSRVRVHTDAQAAESASAVQARAFTVGQDIVFGANQYAPGSHGGRELLAHELAHTVQQSRSSASAFVARACLPAADCRTSAEGSLGAFVAKTEADPVNAGKAARHQTLCNAVPRNPACTSDGHGRPATELQKFLAFEMPARVSAIKGVFVDMDIPAQYGAYTTDCGSFTPPIAASAGEQCTFVPNQFEREAGVYNSGAAIVGNRDRRSWSQEAVRRLVHETEHALFERTPAETKLSGNPCDFDSIKDSLTELASIISEFRPVYLKIQGLAEPAREAELRGMFQFWIKSRGESISGNVKDIRCKCDCGPADAYIKNMFRFASKGWNTYQLWLYNTRLREPQWGLNWPVDPPDSVSVDEIPSAIPSMDIADLPKK
jgi:hypothetical protein